MGTLVLLYKLLSFFPFFIFISRCSSIGFLVLLVLLFALVERFVVSCMLADPGGARAALQTPPSLIN